MRTDVKIGIVLSMALVLLFGSYFFYRGDSQTPISLTDAGKPARSLNKKQKKTGKLAEAPKKKLDDPAAFRTTQPRPKRLAMGTKTSTPTDPATHARAARRQATKTQPRPSRTGKTLSPTKSVKRDSTQLADTTGSSANLAATNLLAAPNQATFRIPTTPNAATFDTQYAAVDVHRVQPGDTFASLAAAYYGNTTHVAFLMNANPNIKEPKHLRIGTTIRIPPLSTNTKAPYFANRTVARKPITPQTTTPAKQHRTYRVQAGDSFYRIARDQLGDAGRWRELLAMNDTLVHGDPTRLQVGHVVLLPNN